MERSAVHLVVRGRVQGVGFRAGAIAEATRLGLSGWVRNRMDGSVEAHAEGTPEQIARFVAWCQQGPRASRVDEVQTTPVAPSGLERGFQVGTTG